MELDDCEAGECRGVVGWVYLGVFLDLCGGLGDDLMAVKHAVRGGEASSRRIVVLRGLVCRVDEQSSGQSGGFRVVPCSLQKHRVKTGQSLTTRNPKPPTASSCLHHRGQGMMAGSRPMKNKALVHSPYHKTASGVCN